MAFFPAIFWVRQQTQPRTDALFAHCARKCAPSRGLLMRLWRRANVSNLVGYSSWSGGAALVAIPRADVDPFGLMEPTCCSAAIGAFAPLPGSLHKKAVGGREMGERFRMFFVQRHGFVPPALGVARLAAARTPAVILARRQGGFQAHACVTCVIARPVRLRTCRRRRRAGEIVTGPADSGVMPAISGGYARPHRTGARCALTGVRPHRRGS